jgi:hypothetical protein
MVTRRGEDAAVLVSVAEWERLRQSAGPTLKELLLTDWARTDSLVPPRRRMMRTRPPPSFDD